MAEATEVTQLEILRFNGQEYPIEGLSDKAKYLASQIQDLQGQSNAQKARLDQIGQTWYLRRVSRHNQQNSSYCKV